MRLNPILRPSIAAIFIFTCRATSLAAPPAIPFTGEVISDNINIRSDSTVSAEPVCKINKGQAVEVVFQLYNWYKIRLPKTASCFIKKSLVSSPAQTPDAALPRDASVLRDNVNIRLHPAESSMIIGKASQGQPLKILEEAGGWYRIEPPPDSFGWIHKKFVVIKTAVLEKTAEPAPQQAPAQEKPKDDSATVEGIIKPYGRFFKRQATHKLTTKENLVYLLKGDKKSLDNFNNRQAKISGKIINAPAGKIPILEVEKIEIVNGP